MRVVWEKGDVHIRADEALADSVRSAPALEEATKFIKDTLSENGGKILSTTLSKLAEEQGISPATFRKAKRMITKKFKEKGQRGKWYVKLLNAT